MNDYNRFIKRMADVYPKEKEELEKKKKDIQEKKNNGKDN